MGEPLKGLERLGEAAIDIRRDEVDEVVVHPLTPFSLLPVNTTPIFS